jgi:hypothetical protein
MDSKVELTAMGRPLRGSRATMARGQALGRERKLRADERLAPDILLVYGDCSDWRTMNLVV